MTSFVNVDSQPKRGTTESSYKDLLNSIDGIVWEADATTFAFTFVSEKAEALLGFPIERWYEQNFWASQIHPDDRDRAIGYCVAATGRGEDHQFEYRMACADGSYVWLKDIVSYVIADDGTKLLRGVMLDITNQKGIEVELKLSEQRFRQLAENIKGVFWMHSPNGKRMIYVSPAYETVWGRSRESLYKDPRSFADAILSEDRDRTLAAIRNRANVGFEVEYRIRRPDGSIRWIWDRGFPIRDANGETYRVAGIAEDITERKRLEEQLLQSQKMEAIGQLAGGVAHDFNNLLTAIIGYSDLVLRKLPPDDPIAKHVEEIRKSGNRAAGLTRQLLAFSRKQIMQPRLLDLNSVVHEIEQILRRLIGENIDLTVETDPLLGVIRADPGQIEQVVLNLAVNARDAMTESGKLEISTKNATLDEKSATAMGLQPGEYVCLAVSDDGTGIDAEHLDHIFEPFFTTKETGKGTGLGLSTVYGIVRQSGGHAMVESETGCGSVFRVYLPRIMDGGLQDAEVLQRQADLTGNETVLLVEDEKIVRDLLESILVQSGYSVFTAPNGNEALGLSGPVNQRFDLLITDVIMPGLNGHELAARLTAIQPDMRVLYMSGYNDDSNFGSENSSPQANFIQKPFLPAELVKKVRSVLDGRASAIDIST